MSAAVSRIHPAGLAEAVAARRRSLADEGFTARLLAADPTLWPEPEEAGTRLGWLALPESMQRELAPILEFAREVAADGVRDVVVLGMGGSSLAPEVFSRLLAQGERGARLSIVDSTHPATVAASLEAFPPESSIYLAASKSGTTVETTSLLDTFWQAAAGLRDRSRHFVALTDPGSSLQARAEAQRFRRIFLAPPDVGGRYSALTDFGLVPAALIGIDIAALLASARAMLERVDEAIDLGILLAEAVRAGRDKLTFEADAETAPLLPWLEQLIAESLGKQGSGVVPVFGEPPAVHRGPDRIFVRLSGGENERREADRELVDLGHPLVDLSWTQPLDVGGELMRWEVATAVAGAVLGLQPFDQPDVDLAKQLARAAMTAPAATDDPQVVDASDGPALERAIGQWLATAAPGDYIALQAFLPAGEEVLATLEGLRANLAATGLPTTLGFGPRFLHSTGQLHKGGRAGVFCLQLFDRGGPDVEIPGAGHGFRQLIDAQALGDARALMQRGRPVLRVRLGD